MRQSHSDLVQQLRSKLAALRVHGKSFDDGNREVEAQTLAVDVRVLVHDTGRSKSLLTQLNRKNAIGYSATPGGRFQGGMWSHLTRSEVYSIHGRPEQRYTAFKDAFPRTESRPVADVDFTKLPPGFVVPEVVTTVDWREVKFDEWWNQYVLWDDKGNTLSRREVTLHLANQDGGAHVDPKLDTMYAAFSRQNALGWQMFQETETGLVTVPDAIDRPERGCMRQIAYELERTLDLHCADMLGTTGR